MNERLKMNGYRANPASIDFEVDCGPLPVRGELPFRLAGVLVRNGPNPLHPDPVRHWFAGHGMVHCFEFANGGRDVPEPLGTHAALACRTGECGRRRRRLRRAAGATVEIPHRVPNGFHGRVAARK